MNQILENISGALDALAKAILNITVDERTYSEIYGWNQASVTGRDLAYMSSSLAVRIRDLGIEELESDLANSLQKIPARLVYCQTNTVPQLASANALQAVPAYTATIDAISRILAPILDWQILDNKAMPANIARRLRTLQAQINNIAPEMDAIQTQVELIQEAADTAESLPEDLESLKKARAEVSRISEESAILLAKITERSKDSAGLNEDMVLQQIEATKLVQQCEEAYRITTTKGLAAAFDQRANRLAMSIRLWVGALMATLISGAYLGFGRVERLSSLLNSENPQWGVIWMDVALSLLSVGPIIWFAWLATKQIGQRFRLSEDYAFKASVAKAYEGYRREAARIDETFEARLFASALTRLEEAPLRLVEVTSHGSPWHDLVSSEAFQKAMNIVPDLKDKFIELAKSQLPHKQNIKLVEDLVVVPNQIEAK